MSTSDQTTAPFSQIAPSVDPGVDPAQELWEQIATHQALSPEKIEEYHEHMRTTSRLPLGALLIKRKYISIRSIMHLLTLQVDEPHMRIGV